MLKLAMAAAAACALAAPAIAEDWDFVLTNKTGKVIKTVELAPSNTTTWQANKIDPEYKKDPTIKDGGRTTIHFDKGPGCKYDVKVTFADDSSAVWPNLNVCDNAFVTIRYTGDKPSFG